MLQRPLTQIHDVGSFVDADGAIGRGGGQQESEVSWSELDVRHRRSGIDEAGFLHPMRARVGTTALAGHFFPYGGGTVEGTRCDDL